MEKFNHYKVQIEKQLQDETKPWTPVFKFAEAYTGVSRFNIFAGMVATILLLLVIGNAGKFVCTLIGVTYPVYASLKALESTSKEDDTKWLIYWVVYAVFSCVEFFADIIVGWFPMYWLSKTFFMIWLMVPTSYNGSLILYREFIRPFFLKQEPNVSKVVSSAEKTIETTLSSSTHKQE